MQSLKHNLKVRIEELHYVLSKIHTLPKIIKIILTKVSSYYNMTIQDVIQINNNEQYSLKQKN